MDDNEKRLEILRRTKKRRKQVDITFILAALAVHAHGNIDFGFDKAKNKGRLDLAAFPAAPDPDSVPDLVFQLQVGDQTIDGKACRNDSPDPGQNSRPFQAGNFGKGQRKFRLMGSSRRMPASSHR